MQSLLKNIIKFFLLLLKKYFYKVFILYEVHYPVLLKEVLEAFQSLEGGIFVDCTLGYAGHSQAILQAHSEISLLAGDQDDEALAYSRRILAPYKNRISLHKSRFSQLLSFLSEDEQEKISGLLADIGLSSLQLDKNDRGFSLNSDFLDMRMNQEQEKDAKFIVNNYSLEKLSEIFYNYGELSSANFLASKIVTARAKKEIQSSKELYEIIGKSKERGRKIQQAILVFQALRIEVNQELQELESLLDAIENSKIKRAKIAFISFHSLEDRIIKNRFKKWAKSCLCPAQAIKCECGNNKAIGKILGKAKTASKEELKINSRSSSAKLRVFEMKR